MEIHIPLAKVRRALFALMALVVGAGLAGELSQHVWSPGHGAGLTRLFSLSYEQNIPTWYSSSLLLACAALLALIAAGARKAGSGYTRHWWVLALGFLYISLDETVSLHEAAGWLRLGGVLYFSWVIPAAAVVAVVGLSYLRFLGHLPRRTRNQFIIAGVVYVTGAVLMELPLGYWTEREGSHNLGYGLIDLVEESLEILGMSMFLLSLLEYLGRSQVRLAFAPTTKVNPGSDAPSTPTP